MENFLERLINKDFQFYFFLHFIDKKCKKIQENRGNNDLWKTSIKGDV